MTPVPPPPPLSAAVPEQAAPGTYQQSAYQQNGAYQQAGAFQQPGMYAPQPVPLRQASPLGAELGGAIRGVFSGDPAAATATASEAKSPIWTLLGGAYVVIFAFTPFLLARSFLSSLMDTVSDTFGDLGLGGYSMPGSYFTDMLNQIFGQVFGYSLLLGIVSFFIWATATHILFHSQPTTVGYVQSMNLASAALIPSTAGMVAGIILSLAYAPLGFLCIGIGQFASSMLVYQGVRHTNRLTKPAFWAYILICVGSILGMALCAFLLAKLIFF